MFFETLSPVGHVLLFSDFEKILRELFFHIIEQFEGVRLFEFENSFLRTTLIYISVA